MTEQHNLKKKVRERMERTGESYTSAHRSILAVRPNSRHPGSVPGYPAFGSEQHSPAALCRHMLAVNGVDVSEPMAFGLGGGIGFLYAVFEYKQVSHQLDALQSRWETAMLEAEELEAKINV